MAFRCAEGRCCLFSSCEEAFHLCWLVGCQLYFPGGRGESVEEHFLVESNIYRGQGPLEGTEVAQETHAGLSSEHL